MLGLWERERWRLRVIVRGDCLLNLRLRMHRLSSGDRRGKLRRVAKLLLSRKLKQQRQQRRRLSRLSKHLKNERERVKMNQTRNKRERMAQQRMSTWTPMSERSLAQRDSAKSLNAA